MKKIFYFILLLSFFSETFAQQYDLIVNAEGDSIACKIDSITDAAIYFEMKTNDKWVSTHVYKKEIIEYKHDAIEMKKFVFKPGTSYILSTRQDSASVGDLQRNSVYIGILTFSYSRMIPGKRVSYTFAGGISLIDAFGILAESTLLIGNKKHFFEPGILVDFSSEFGVATVLRTGYRYQGPKGFLFRIALMLAYLPSEKDLYPLPGASIGYSF